MTMRKGPRLLKLFELALAVYEVFREFVEVSFMSRRVTLQISVDFYRRKPAKTQQDTLSRNGA